MGSSDTYHTPVFIGLLCVMCFAVVLLLHHCVLVVCYNRNRRRRAASAAGQQQQGDEEEEREEDEEASNSVDSSSRAHLVKGAAAVVCPYRKEEAWGESTCAVCLADFADGEPVRVLPECMHYFHADCIDTWLRGGSTSCPMCRAETTPTPSPGELNHNLSSLSVSVSLEEILVRT